MTSLTFISLSGALSFGVPVLLAVPELLVLRTTREGRDEPPPEAPPVPAPKPLPACLLPADQPDAPTPQVRIFELA